MARSTGYPCCEHEGVKHYGWNSEQTCIYSCKDDCNCICVEPEVTCIEAWTAVIINADGVAEMLTIENKDAMECCSEVFFSVCPVKPKECGKQRYFMSDLKIAGQCINWKAMGAETPEDIKRLERIMARNKIRVVWPHVN